MKVARWGNSLAIRIPAEVAARLNLKEGDDVEVTQVNEQGLQVAREWTVDQAIARIRSMQRPFPVGWKFDRDEANER